VSPLAQIVGQSGRVGYFRKLLDQVLKLDYRGAAALDVGCGGGILAEEFAAMGFRVTGIDPSEQSLAQRERSFW